MPDMYTMQRMIQPHLRADVATLSNEMIFSLYYDLFPSAKPKHEKDKSLRDTFRRVRHPGKTRKDQARGAEKQRLANQLERANWRNAGNAHRSNTSGGLKTPFPRHTCNGKRNRRRIGAPIQ